MGGLYQVFDNLWKSSPNRAEELHKFLQLPNINNFTLKASNYEFASKSHFKINNQKLTNCPDKSDSI
jgi:hypothetical protein